MWKVLAKSGTVVAALALPVAAAVPASADEIAPTDPVPAPAPNLPGLSDTGALPVSPLGVLEVPLELVTQLLGAAGGAGDLGGLGLPGATTDQQLTGGATDVLGDVDGGLGGLATVTDLAQLADLASLTDLGSLLGGLSSLPTGSLPVGLP